MDKDTEKFILFIKNKYGLDLSANRSFAQKHLSSDIIRTRTGSVNEYVRSVKNNKNAENDMISKLVTNHTYFFRDTFHFTHTLDTLIPAVLKNHTKPVINIWCCAVSTGQEAYSLAMTLDCFLKNVRFKITASDLSPNAVETARRGIYPASALEQIPEMYRKLYCTDNNDGTFSVSEKLKR
ncbi:MAG: hypothetical protein J1F64_01325, partial [Oscillospiraceae bacterium]|nr:hypothetical protein [Oscillospiraceae bacterium]